MAKVNKGEWSEFYAFLKLLNEKQLNGADEDLHRIQDIFYPILKIIREESDGNMTYEFADGNKVRVLKAGTEIALVDSSDLKVKIADIFKAIRNNTDTFEIPEANELMARFHSNKVTASNSHKEDIVLQIHDRITGAIPEVGFSIKSMLGAPSTLLNPSTATNFIYKISGLDESKIDAINAIDTNSKVKDRLAEIIANGGVFSYAGIASDTFTKNLRRVDTVLPEIVARLLLSFYCSKKKSSLPQLISSLGDDETNILNFELNHADYEFKIKGLLHNVALGMVPDTAWDGLIHAHGGYIIVREDGEVVCYHVYNADAFRSYLYKNTRFDTPSTTRYDFGKIYREDGNLFIKLNLQIRFIR